MNTASARCTTGDWATSANCKVASKTIKGRRIIHRGNRRKPCKFAALVGIGLLPASLLTGWLWTFFGPKAAFITGGCLGLTASLAMGIVLGKQKYTCV